MNDLAAELSRVLDERDALQSLAEMHTTELENLARVKDEFVATASHDLRAPLTSILGYAQLVIRILASPTPDFAKVARGMAIIESQALAMTGLLDDVLDASRIQLGALELRRSTCEMDKCLASVVARLGPEVRNRVVVATACAPVVGYWDRKRLEQVLANLVDNALKYSPDDQRVSVKVERHAAGIEVAVSDRGMGISKTELPRLFERFYRTSQAHDSGLVGSGLGLYICRGIVAAHGGRLWAESSGEGQGTTFRFTLPDYRAPGDGPKSS